jgi:2-C-methyl-D-erythritol 2,4-cyclodiphosphate synthase
MKKNNRFETTDASTYQLLLDKAREMRKNPTEAESVLWSYLSDNKMGVHFRRQHPVYGYIPDFVSLKNQIIIEIDGGYHFEGEQPEKDAERSEYLREAGFTVLRFTNEEVLCDIDNTLEEIADALEDCNCSSNQAPQPSGVAGCGFRIGMGYDVHRIVEGRELWMGGIKIPFYLPSRAGGAGGGFFGLLGHSDADVLIHAICDAILGAANMRDIGYHFPDTSAETDGMDSKIILKKTIELIATKGYQLVNIDATICAEKPKMNPHIPDMQQCMANVIGCDPDQISIKATTTEKLGFTGRQEGISAYAVALIERS